MLKESLKSHPNPTSEKEYTNVTCKTSNFEDILKHQEQYSTQILDDVLNKFITYSETPIFFPKHANNQYSRANSEKGRNYETNVQHCVANKGFV